MRRRFGRWVKGRGSRVLRTEGLRSRSFRESRALFRFFLGICFLVYLACRRFSCLVVIVFFLVKGRRMGF